MPKSYTQKLKILYIYKLLFDNTDEEHVLSMKDLIDQLDSLSIPAERKSLYDDISSLNEFGYCIEYKKGKDGGYYLADRTFELAELKLLVDAVQSSKFITQKKSAQLIKKIESLTSKHEAKQLQRQVFVSNRTKSMNESVFYNVDSIHKGINEKTKITFKYFEYTLNKEKQFRKNGALYKVNPYAMIWDDEYYYLIAYDGEAQKIKHYRVDKMINIEQLSEKRESTPFLDQFDLGEYINKTFGMYGGEEKFVSLKMENSLINVIFDRFGKDITVIKSGSSHFTVNIKVAVSPQFFGWVFGLGNKIQITSPTEVAEQMKDYLKDISALYSV